MSFIMLIRQGEWTSDKGLVADKRPSKTILNTDFIREVYVNDDFQTVIRFDGQGSFAGQTWVVTKSFDDLQEILTRPERRSHG